jgi:hypothetical protein
MVASSERPLDQVIDDIDAWLRDPGNRLPMVAQSDG